jgi:hypothetical protein
MGCLSSKPKPNGKPRDGDGQGGASSDPPKKSCGGLFSCFLALSSDRWIFPISDGDAIASGRGGHAAAADERGRQEVRSKKKTRGFLTLGDSPRVDAGDQGGTGDIFDSFEFKEELGRGKIISLLFWRGVRS